MTINSSTNLNILNQTFSDEIIKRVVPIETQDSIEKYLIDVFYEMIDNIKRHVIYDNGEYADSYFNFYYNSLNNEFNFILVDNYAEGFINTYYKTAIKEHKTSEDKDNDIYLKTIQTLKNPDNDISFLTEFFTEDGWFEGNKIPRIMLHFGIPLLIDRIKKINGEILIRLHRKINDNTNIYYKVQISSGSKPQVSHDENWGIQGTYISITIPNVGHSTEKKITANIPPTNQDFKDILKNKKEIKGRISTFVNESKKTEFNRYKIFDYNNSPADIETVSDYIRYLHIETKTNNTTDAYIINFPITEKLPYLNILIRKIFNVSDDERYLKTNYLFHESGSFKMLFLGGKNLQEFCQYNKIILGNYCKSSSILSQFCKNSSFTKELVLDSFLFYKIDKDDHYLVLPFELFTEDIDKKLSLERRIRAKLEQRKKSIHIDTKKGIHINAFYEFSTILTDSSFTERISYKLYESVLKLISEQESKNISIIGLSNYLNLLLADYTQNYTNHKSYFIIDDLDGEIKKLVKFIHEQKDTTSQFIIISSISFENKKFEKFEKIIDSYNLEIKYTYFNIFELSLEDHPKTNGQYNSLFNIELSTEDFHTHDKNYCSICNTPNKEVPLYFLDQKDDFKIKDLLYFYENTTPKKATSYYDTFTINWNNAINRAHIVRNNTHFTFYINANILLKNNTLYMNEFLKVIAPKVNLRSAQNVILAPMHSTIGDFLILLNQLVFDNKANILQYNVDNKYRSQNLLNIKSSINLKELSSYNFYFVDDIILSGSTLKYFHSLLNDIGVSGFEKIITIIDGTNNKREKFIYDCLYENHIGNYISFVRLNINPVKYSTDDYCFICEKKKNFINLLNTSYLDMNRFSIANIIIKMNKVAYDTLEYGSNFTNTSFLDSIKMLATHYVNENLFNANALETIAINDSSKRLDTLNYYYNLEKNFQHAIKILFLNLNFVNEEDYAGDIESISNYVAELSLLKALTYPKTVFYEHIRYLITLVLVNKIKLNIKSENAIDYYFNIKNLYQLKSFQNPYLAKLIDKFIPTRNMDYVNFLFLNASYLGVNYVIHSDSIKYYFSATEKIKKDPDVDDNLYKKYQLAVKIVASLGKDQSKFLKENIDIVEEAYNNHEISGYINLLNALKLENIYEENIFNFKNEFDKLTTQNLSLTNIIHGLDKTLQKLLSDETIKTLSIFLNKRSFYTYSSYEHYLNEIDLIDILNKCNMITEEHNPKIYRLVKGALKDFGQIPYSHPKDIEHIDNTWINDKIINYKL